MNTIGKIISVVFALFLFFILPIFYHASKQDAIIQIFVQTETRKFVDQIRCNGSISEAMYVEFLSVLDSTGNLYEVTMDHAHWITEPKVDDIGRVTGYYEYSQSTYETELLEVICNGAGIYHMSQGDYFSVKVNNRTDTYQDFLEHFLYGKKTTEYRIVATAGGMILDEEER
ncbi:MAG: hypothetical protein ACERKN_03300 [Velocimicrobium sp.]